MAIHLNADQKNLRKLYGEYETFVIPPYQRPYSWTINECRQLYDDLIDAFNRKNDNDYFVGTIILAVADEDENEYPRIVDGQQRLTTFWLLFKALSTLLPDVTSLTECLYSKNWDGSGKNLRIMSQVNDKSDLDEMNLIDNWDAKDYDLRIAKTEEEARKYGLDFEDSFFEDVNLTNATIYFYKRLKDIKTDWGVDKLRDFARFLIKSVLILPIEMHAPGIHDAEDKALTIFETINNRGMDLANSDIFKARLYSKAITTEQKEEFIDMWDTMVKECKSLDIDIDHLFTIYMLIITSKELSNYNASDIREFFDGRNGELSHHSYEEIMSELLDISQSLLCYKDMSIGTSRIAGWLQLLDIGKNDKIDTILVAWKKSGDKEDKDTDAFLSKLVKYSLIRRFGLDIYSVQSIINEILTKGESPKLHNITNALSFEIPYFMRHPLESKLAMILEMGGGLLPSYEINIVRRKMRTYIETDYGTKIHQETHFDTGIGNVAFVPNEQAKQAKVFDKYMERMRTVDPECASLADGKTVRYYLKDVRAREERKKKALTEFFNSKQTWTK